MADNSDFLNELSADQRKQAETAQAPVQDEKVAPAPVAPASRRKAADPDSGGKDKE